MQKGRLFLVHKAHSYPNVSYEYTICMQLRILFLLYTHKERKIEII